jgi:PST family polysaccharide transporter/teichuronic acid exporter
MNEQPPRRPTLETPALKEARQQAAQQRADLPQNESSPRRLMTQAAGWTMLSFVVRRAGEALLLLLIGWLVAREDYGRFVAWKAILPPLLVLCAGGWDTVYLRSKSHAASRLWLLSVWSIVTSLLLAALILVFAGSLAAWYRDPALEPWFRLAGLSLLFRGVLRVLHTVCARRLEHGVLARWEVIRFGIWGVGVISVLLMNPSAEVVTLSNTIKFIAIYLFAEFIEAAGLAVISHKATLAFAVLGQNRGHHAPLRRLLIWRKNRRFCALITFDGMVNALSVGLPVYLIGRYLNADAVTLFAFGSQLVLLPLYSLLDSANRVMLPGLRLKSDDELPQHAGKIVDHLSVLCLPLLLFLFVFAPQLFAALFGGDWIESGYITRFFIVYLVLAPMTNISGAVEALKDRPEVGLVWNLVTLLGRILALMLGLRWHGLLGGMLAYGLFSAAMWAFYQYLIARMLNVSLRDWLANYVSYIPVWSVLLGGWFGVQLALDFGDGRFHQLSLMLAIGLGGLLLYTILLALFHRETLRELLQTSRHLLPGSNQAA